MTESKFWPVIQKAYSGFNARDIDSVFYGYAPGDTLAKCF